MSAQHPACSRRQALKSAGALAFALGAAAIAPSARAVEPFARPGASRLALSLAAYSFRDYFKAPEKRPAGADRTKPVMDVPAFIDYCIDNGCLGTELTSYYFPANASDDYFAGIRRYAFLRGIAVSGSAISNNFAQAKGKGLSDDIAYSKKWIDKCAILGAPHIRVFAGAPKGVTADEGRKSCIESLEEVADYAGAKGIFLGLENHGGIVAEADGILAIVKAVKSKWLGINLDSGNFHTADPYGDIAKIAPYAVNVQYKADVYIKGDKNPHPADMARVVKILRDANYQGYVALEYESKEDPWTAVPPLLKRLKEALAA